MASSGLYSFYTHYYICSLTQPASLFTHIYIILVFKVLFDIVSDINVPKRHLNLGLSMSHGLNHEAAALTTRPPWPDYDFKLRYYDNSILLVFTLMMHRNRMKHPFSHCFVSILRNRKNICFNTSKQIETQFAQVDSKSAVRQVASFNATHNRTISILQ